MTLKSSRYTKLLTLTFVLVLGMELWGIDLIKVDLIDW